MDRIATAPRMHPLMAVAALSVITVCAAGTAALTGLLPSSKADVPAQLALAPQQMIGPQQAFAAQEAGPRLAQAPLAEPTPRVVTHVHKHVTEVRHVKAAPRQHQRSYAAAPAPARAAWAVRARTMWSAGWRPTCRNGRRTSTGVVLTPGYD